DADRRQQRRRLGWRGGRVWWGVHPDEQPRVVQYLGRRRRTVPQRRDGRLHRGVGVGELRLPQEYGVRGQQPGRRRQGDRRDVHRRRLRFRDVRGGHRQFTRGHPGEFGLHQGRRRRRRLHVGELHLEIVVVVLLRLLFLAGAHEIVVVGVFG